MAIALALLLHPLFNWLPVAGLTAPFITACWLMHVGNYLFTINQRRDASHLHG
jgi:urea transporter